MDGVLFVGKKRNHGSFPRSFPMPEIALWISATKFPMNFSNYSKRNKYVYIMPLEPK